MWVIMVLARYFSRSYQRTVEADMDDHEDHSVFVRLPAVAFVSSEGTMLLRFARRLYQTVVANQGAPIPEISSHASSKVVSLKCLEARQALARQKRTREYYLSRSETGIQSCVLGYLA